MCPRSGDEHPRRTERTAAIDVPPASGWIHEHRDETKPEDRQQRDVERHVHPAEHQGDVTWLQAVAGERACEPHALTVEFGERHLPIAVHDRDGVRPRCHLPGEQLDDVHSGLA